MTEKIEILFPLIPDRIDENYPFEQQGLVLKEITEVLNSLKLTENNYIETHSVKVEISEKQPELKAINLQNLNIPYLQNFCLTISILIEINFNKYSVTIYQGENSYKVSDEKELLIHLRDS